MAKVKIIDLSQETEMSKNEMKNALGGLGITTARQNTFSSNLYTLGTVGEVGYSFKG